MSSNFIYDVIIVGAGLGGLSAGEAIKEEGLTYKILEAHSRPGGKVFSVTNENKNRYFELGAQFVNADMTEIISFIQKVGMQVIETNTAPNAVLIDEIRKRSIESKIQELIEGLEIEEHGNDNKSLFDLYTEKISDEYDRKIMNSVHSEYLNVNTKFVSRKSLMDINKRIPSGTGDDTTHQSSGPLNHVIEYLVKKSSGHIIYNSPVIQVFEKEGKYNIHTEKTVYQSKAVIAAVPPTAASKISYNDEMKIHYQNALEDYIDGAVIKTTWVFEKPFWHHYISNEKITPLKGVIYTEYPGVYIVDSSKKGAEHRLTMFIGADVAKSLVNLSEQERLDFALKRLVQGVGLQAAQFLDVAQSSWANDPFYGGGYGAVLKSTGRKNSIDVLQTPFNNFVFACSEVSSSYPNFMEGAIRSGKNAAKYILKNRIQS